jgi:hypothetical protein
MFDEFQRQFFIELLKFDQCFEKEKQVYRGMLSMHLHTTSYACIPMKDEPSKITPIEPTFHHTANATDTPTNHVHADLGNPKILIPHRLYTEREPTLLIKLHDAVFLDALPKHFEALLLDGQVLIE